MKKIFTTMAALLMMTGFVAAQELLREPEGFQFTDQKVAPITPVKDQHRSGTCWCFSTLSFLEAEILKQGGEEIHLSEMWIVRNIYFEKAVKYVRLHGALNFAVGGASHDVIHGIKQYGIVPHEVYTGFNYGTDKPHFNEIDAVLKSYVDAIIQAPNKTLTTAWQNGLNAILDAYFGPMPETFTWKGQEYTPQSFAASLPINLDDYVDLSSYTHHPFYEEFVIEVPDNWMWGTVYNLPLEELMQTVDYAIEQGYTIEWATDVSEKGFSRTKAIGIVPDANFDGLDGTEAERWGRLTDAERERALYSFDGPVRELEITQEMRQTAFDNYETTDDHGMVIVGSAVDQQGNPYFKVLNSWGVRGPYDGYFYFSRPFFAYKTMSIMINKNAIPKAIRKKLGL
uniref:aminopeptidase C n=1 Tax=Alistipes sp. TaxID=1872444 RepID=UPI00405638C5